MKNWLIKIAEHSFSIQQIKELGTKIGIDWNTSEFTPDDLVQGYKVELEHGKADPETNVTNNDPAETAKIAWAHLKERADYYRLLAKIEGH